MLIAITDHRFPDVDTERAVIEAAGGKLVVGQCATADELIELCRNADGILNARAQLSREVIEALQKCKAIVRYGIGVDSVDILAASDRGIRVFNVPAYCIDEVSDHALALLLAWARRLPAASELALEPVWKLDRMPPLRRLRGQTLGLIGLGRIGSLFAQKALALGMKVIVHDPHLPQGRSLPDGVARVGLDEVIAQADYLSLHAPLSSETRHLIGREAISRMKPLAVVINTARGGLIDQEALVEALESGTIAGAALDVLEDEGALPLPSRATLLNHPNAIVTAHTAWLSVDARADLQRCAAEQVVAALRGEPVENCVNCTRSLEE